MMSDTARDALNVVLRDSGFTADLSKDRLIGLSSGGKSEFFEEKPIFEPKADERWVIEKINFNDSCPIHSIQFLEKSLIDDYFENYVQIKTQTGDKYFLELNRSSFLTLRKEAFLHSDKINAFIDRSFDYLQTSLIIETVPDYWVGLKGYKAEITETYDAIHQDMLTKLKERLQSLPEGSRIRLIEIGCGRGELMKKALSDPEIAPLVSRVVLLDLHSENTEIARTNVKDVQPDLSCATIAQGMPKGIDEIPDRAPGEYTLVLSSGSLTHQVLTQDQAIQTMEKLHEKADEVIVGGLANSWINKKVAKQLGFSAEQQPKITHQMIKIIPYGPDDEPLPNYTDADIIHREMTIIENASPDLVTVFKREDRCPQAAATVCREPKSVKRHFELKSKLSEERARSKDEGTVNLFKH